MNSDQTTLVQITKSNPTPLYYQICEIIRDEIATLSLQPGELLPSETELIKRFNVSRATVRKALDALAAEGVVYRLQGKGTFVSDKRIGQELTALTGFVEDMLELGFTPSSQLLKTDQVAASSIVAKQLNLSPGDMVTYIERLRLADNIPLSFDTTWLPDSIGQKIVSNDLNIYPIYSLLEDKYNIILDEANYKVDASTAEGEIADLLQIQPGDPIFVITRTAYTTEKLPIDYEKLYYRADRISFSMHFDRKRPTWRMDSLDRKLSENKDD
ncbi:MAG: GntR family transcriptional regulator [Spirochaetales bacterium]|nr:GntR family transcriptional regulator [Spirochaetales bacterium]